MLLSEKWLSFWSALVIPSSFSACWCSWIIHKLRARCSLVKIIHLQLSRVTTDPHLWKLVSLHHKGFSMIIDFARIQGTGVTGEKMTKGTSKPSIWDRYIAVHLIFSLRHSTRRKFYTPLSSPSTSSRHKAQPEFTLMHGRFRLLKH